MAEYPYDFSGYVTYNDVRCSDGRTIKHGAFSGNHNQVVPLVWNHEHQKLNSVLGHVLLEERENGMYGYASLNDTDDAITAGKLIKHGDIKSFSIYANHLKHSGNREVIHGEIREVSLVHAGANPKAFIDTILMHSYEGEEEGIIAEFCPLDLTSGVIKHGDDSEADESEQMIKEDNKKPEETEEETEPMANEVLAHAENNGSGKTIGDVLKTLNDEQETAMFALIAQILEDKKEDGDMSHNIFEQDNYEDEALQHAEMLCEIFDDIKKTGSLSNACLAHGVEHLEYLFPDAKLINKEPMLIKRDDAWVSKVMNGTHHSPFSRIRTLVADITEDEARARGYIKGNKKKDEVFKLLKRVTSPSTIYKKQSFHRDDLIDIEDTAAFLTFLRAEMRMMLEEEIARAILISDGRPAGSEDKISEDTIRPIWTDDDLYTVKVTFDTPDTMTADQRAKTFIRTIIKSRKQYKGSGNPTLFTTNDIITDCLLLEDATGRIIYDSLDKLKTTLRVKEIVEVEVMEGAKREATDGKEHELLGIIVNLQDYYIGADKGGQVTSYDDFDIDYNLQKYLIETRISGSLVKPYSAMVIEAILPEATTG